MKNKRKRILGVEVIRDIKNGDRKLYNKYRKKSVKKANLLAEQRYLQSKGIVNEEEPIKENDSKYDVNKFVPGLSDSDWGLKVNMLTGHFPGGKDIQGVMLHNQDVIKVIPKLLDPEVMDMVEILKQHPEIVKKLNNA